MNDKMTKFEEIKKIVLDFQKRADRYFSEYCEKAQEHFINRLVPFRFTLFHPDEFVTTNIRRVVTRCPVTIFR